MLTSRAREFLVDTEWVIVDEIHAVARTKRGAHLALTLERLEELVKARFSALGCRPPSGPSRKRALPRRGRTRVSAWSTPGCASHST